MTTLWADLLFDGNHFVDGPCSISLDGDRISRIAPLAAGLPAPTDVLDARGALVMPGLVNAHVHIARGGAFEPQERISVTQVVRNLQDTLASGVTTVGDMGCAAGVIAQLRSHVAAHPASGPAICASGPILTAPRGYPLDWLPPVFTKLGVALTCADEADAARAVQRVAEAGMDHVKLAVMHQTYANRPMPAVTEPVAKAVVQEAHRLKRRVLAHAHSTADYRVALAAGVDALMHSSFEPLDAETLKRVVDAGIPVCPTLWVFESICLGAEHHWEHDEKYRRHVVPNIQDSWRRFAEAYAESGDVIPPGIAGGLAKQAVREAVRIASANLLLLRDAGVPIAFGNDASYGFSLVARPVDELAALQRAGLDVETCLRAATSEAARLLSCSDRGRIAEGARADLLVVEERVRREVEAIAPPRAVFAAGQRVSTPGWRDSARTGWAFVRGLASTARDVAQRDSQRRTTNR